MVSHQPTRIPQPVHVMASTVLAVVMRVAGPVITEVRPHALGNPERQVLARIGDALVYLTDPKAAARIRQQWDAAQYLAVKRLPERVSQTWLAPTPDTYPVGVTVQLTGRVDVTTRYLPGAPGHRHPTAPADAR